MSSSADLHVQYQIGNAPVRAFPYPHIYVSEVFPAEFYRELRAHLIPESELKTLGALGRVAGTDYPARLVLPLTREAVARLDERLRRFWEPLCAWLLGGPFGQLMVSKFAPYLAQRLGNLDAVQFQDEALVVCDRTTYALGPHTDSPAKVLSFLFYLPPDDSMAHLGTSIYVPNDPGFFCEGGPHHPFQNFRRVRTMPYLPNTLFAFMKTRNSFHGVEPITEEVRRDLLLYDIKLGSAPQAAPAVKFSF